VKKLLKSELAVCIIAIFALGVSAFADDFISEFHNFDDNQIPAGWTQVIQLGGPGISDGALRGNVTDGRVLLSRQGAMPENATGIRIEYDGNIAYSYWGLHHNVWVALASGEVFQAGNSMAQYNYGSVIRVRVGLQGDNIVTYDQPLEYGDYHHVVTFYENRITYTATRLTDGYVLCDIDQDETGLDISEIDEISIYTGTTTDNSAWSDNLKIEILSDNEVNTDFCDEFDGPSIDNSIWTVATGTWTQSGGRLIGSWPISNPNCDNGNILLHDAVQPTGDYIFEVDMVVSPGGANSNGNVIRLRNSFQNRFHLALEVSSGKFTAGACVNGTKISIAEGYPGSHLNTSVGETNRVRLEKTGDYYSFYLNDDYYMCTIEDTWFAGDVKLGLGTYGSATFERACLYYNAPPMAMCRDVYTAADHDCYADVSVDDGSYDPDGDEITTVQEPPGPYLLGTTEVTLTVTDDNGLSSSCTALVTVSDTSSPEITCPDTIFLVCADSSGAVAVFDIQAYDNCDPNPNVNCVPSSGSVFPIGETQVLCQAIDSSGNESSCSFAVIVSEGLGSIGGTVLASCPGSDPQSLAITVDVYDSTGTLVHNTVTDSDGNYFIDSVLSGQSYTVEIVAPLGYPATYDNNLVLVYCGLTTFLDFNISCNEISAEPRSMGFWKHQVGVALGGNGHAQIGAEALCEYLDLIEAHFNSNEINQVVVYQPPVSGLCEDKLQVAKELLNLKGRVEMIARARQQLMALLFNVASAKISLTKLISEDSATLSQAITYCDYLIDDPDGGHELAKDICDVINNGGTVAAGLIPLDIEDIAYRRSVSQPYSFSLLQNYPNPFNPTTEISFSLPNASDVKLEVYNVMGQKVTTLLNRHLEAGHHSVVWDGSDAASGVYLYHLQAGDIVDTKKMVLLK
jgi:hypothetical protein